MRVALRVDRCTESQSRSPAGLTRLITLRLIRSCFAPAGTTGDDVDDAMLDGPGPASAGSGEENMVR